jgi:hypothetical protein
MLKRRIQMNDILIKTTAAELKNRVDNLIDANSALAREIRAKDVMARELEDSLRSAENMGRIFNMIEDALFGNRQTIPDRI